MTALSWIEQNLTCIQARPTAPRPNTATVLPSVTLQVFHTAPRPVLLEEEYKEEEWQEKVSGE